MHSMYDIMSELHRLARACHMVCITYRMQPIVIHKSVAGLVAIAAGAIAMSAAIIVIGAYAATASHLGSDVVSLVILSMLLVLAIMGGIAWAYWNSTIVIDDTGIRYTNWTSLFSYAEASTKWSELEDVDSAQATIWAQLFGYGTLLVQTAGTQTNLQMTMVPRVKYWADYLYKKLPSTT